MIICRRANDKNGQLFTSIFRDKLSLKGARTLGVAVTLRPGDFLLFSALIPHCVSSRWYYTGVGKFSFLYGLAK
jgi:hypothetical protein